MAKILISGLSILAFLVILMGVIVYIAQVRFFQKADREATELFQRVPRAPKEVVTSADLSKLPGCVQNWLQKSGVVGKEKIHTVRLKQKALMRTAPDKPWMPVEAEQYFTVDEPGFIWKAKVKMAPMVYLTGRDKYANGQGAMLIKALGLVDVVNATGQELDQGTMLRYMAELQWFPTAALNDYLHWEEINAHSARATMTYHGVTASGVYTFNEQGELVDFIAPRYREDGGKYVLDDWGGTGVEFKEFQGIRIGSKVNVIWHYQTGDFNWFQCEVTDIEYNQPLLY